MKNQIRKCVKQRLAMLHEVELANAKAELLHHIKPLIDDATHIAVYHAYGFELSLDLVINYALSLNKILYQPRAFRDIKNMDLIKYNPQDCQVFSTTDVAKSICYKWDELDLNI